MQRVKCVQDRREDLGGQAIDPYIRKGKFYTVINAKIPSPVQNGPEWIEVQCDITKESFQRPRFMFGPVLS